MADAARFAESLRLIADNVGGGDMFDHDANDIRIAANLIESQAAELKEQAAEIERLTPKPTSADDVPSILNAEKHEGCDDWTWDGCQYVGGYERSGLDFVHSQYLSGFAGLAVAEKLVREKEAARG